MRRFNNKRNNTRRGSGRSPQLELLEQRIVMSGEPLANVFGGFEDQVVVAGDVRHVAFSVGEGTFGNGPAFVRIDVASQGAAASRLYGDYNEDLRVDGGDFLVWQRQFGTQGTSSADGNGNGVVDAADYTVWRDNFGASGARFDPSVATLRNSQGETQTPIQFAADTPLGSMSFGVFQIAAGDYSVDVGGAGTGAFELRMTLIGDLDGDHDVDLADLNAIRGLTQTGGYSPSADVNLDGVITSFDYSYARRNNENSLALTAIPQLTLGESNSFASRYSQLIDLRPVEGTRTITIDIDASFDRSASSVQGDLFQVYLLDPSTGEALLAGSADGSALFTLAENGHELAAGRVTYGGGRITVDLSGIAGAAEGELVLQLLSGDTDQGSQVSILNIANEVGEATASLAILSLPSPVFTAGPALDLQSLTSSNELQALISNVRFDPSEGIYRAQLRVKNNGPSTGRNIAVVLPGFAASVQGGNASGISPAGAPYWNLRSAIPSGGLQAGALSGAVEIEIRDPAALRLILTPQILVGEPNRAPQFAALPSLTLHPGEVLEKVFAATDQDGDTLTYSISTPEGLPPSEFSSIGRLTLKPGVGDLGTYHTTITVTDGVLSTSQQLAIVVEADPVTTTRISGFVLGTNGQPLEGIPVEIAGFSARTAADGSFTITLPTMQTPTEAFNISVPAGDLFLDPFNTGTQEIPLRRARFDVTTGDSALNPRQNPNLVTSFIDASVVYGSDETRAAALRTFSDGKLKTSAGNLLPVNNAETFPDGLLENDNEGRSNPTTLFSTGDVRTNENVALIAIHTVLMREHNRLADQIQAANPALSDEAIYQQARRMVGAIIQNITYNEYLPLLLGTGVLAPYAGYNSTVDPSESALFAAAAFRLGHTQLSPEIERLDASGQSLPGGPLALSNAFFTVDPINTDGIEPYLRGLAVTPMQEMDTKIIDAVRNFLFGPPGAGGMDLASLNIQRGRDVGLPSYTQARLDFGLPAITSFAQITSNTALQSALASVYGTVDKVDVWVGGLAENRAAGALVGPLFQAILKDQFQRSRDGDRFWFENGQFTTSELSTIRSTNLEQLIERNAPGVDLPAHPFTTSSQPSAPAPAGTAAATAGTEFRTYDGSGNNLADPNLGANGSNVLRNFTNGYGDGISTPGGADRPGAREISNAVSAQSGALPNSAGMTSLLTFWGQILDHDLGLTPGGVSNTLRIQGNLRPVGQDGAAYPFVAEKMELMLGHAVYPGVNNVISRPIYLPAIDVANGVTVNPAQDTVVTTAAIPGARIVVKAGTLQDRQGHLFAGSLSITEVPRDLTPAALPANLLPDLVVTIQPADMILTQPAPLSLPNRAGWAAGTKMDLWSINPITGFFDIVGQGQVSADGSIVETISGGIRNSSWHMFSPTAEDLKDESKDNLCGDEATAPLASEVELLSGALLEMHNLVPYESLGSVRGLTLSYDSKRANPRAELSFSMAVGATFSIPNQGGGQPLSLLGRATIDVDGTILQSTSTNGSGIDQTWEIGLLGTNDVGSRISAGFAFGLNSVPTGIYSYSIEAGGVRGVGSGISGTLSEVGGKVVTVNGRASAFGAGWGLAGLTEIVESPDGSVLLIDGDGSESVYKVPMSPGDAYVNPMGHFGSLVKRPDGKFLHTMTDQTVYAYNASNKLASIKDRNGNETRFEYSGDKLMRIVDPAGLSTTFQYSGAMVSSITDPTGRTTTLRHDAAGNLTTITDPDQAARSWNYDSEHRMTGETTERGFSETVQYDSNGLVRGAIRSDGTVVSIVPAASRGLQSHSSSNAVKTALGGSTHIAVRTDGNGQASQFEVDRAGQFVSASDKTGSLSSVTRDSNNLIFRIADARGNNTTLGYDEFGNVTSQGETLAVNAGGPLFPGAQIAVGLNPQSVAIGDINGDGRPDIVTSNQGSNNVSVLLGEGNGIFSTPHNFAVGSLPNDVSLGDINGDGRLDIVTSNQDSNNVSVLLGDGIGGFAPAQSVGVGSSPRGVSVGDLNGDGRLDVITANYDSNNVSVLLGDGIGGFAVTQSYAVGARPVSLSLGDFNGDDRLDIVTANNAGNVTILPANSLGGFTSARNVSVGVAPHEVALGDVNGDGRLDIVTTHAPGFTGIAGFVSVLLGDGVGGFATAKKYDVGAYPDSLSLGDINADGHLDIVTTDYYIGMVNVLLGDGIGGFSSSQSYAAGRLPNDVTLGDVNGDGRLDMITALTNTSSYIGSSGGAIGVLLGDDIGSASSQNYGAGVSANYVSLGDVNDDGRLDIVTNGGVRLGDAAGGFAATQSDFAESLSTPTLGDINGDGRLDIVATNFSAKSIDVRLGDGAGAFLNAQNYEIAYSPYGVTLGDVNGDGRLDIVIPTGNSGVISLLLADGIGGFEGPRNFFAGLFIYELSLGDVNGDSRLDIVSGDFNTGNVKVLLGDGVGGFSSPSSVGGGDRIRNVSLGDVNGDDRLDIVTLNSPLSNLPGTIGSAKVNVLLGDGLGGFAARKEYAVGEYGPQYANSILLGDINGDGKLDIVTENFYAHSAVVMMGDGLGGFAASQNFTVGTGPRRVSLGDVNGDGGLDIVAAGGGETVGSPNPGISVLVNRGFLQTAGTVTTSTSYDPTFSQPTSRIDERGNFTNFTIDPANGNITASMSPEGQRMVYTYTASGLVDTMTDSLGRITDYDYNALGRLTTVTYAKGTVDQGIVRYEYDLAGNRTATIDENNHRSEYEYDARNRLKVVRDALGHETKYDYDKAGNVTKITDPLGHVTTNDYDARNRLVRTTDFQGNVTQFGYDAEGNVIRVTDPLGHITKHRYDARHRRIETIDPDGGKTLFRYDADNNLTALIDPEGNRTLFFYDSRNRLTKETDPLGKSITYKYDATDNLIEKKDRNGRVTKYAYDGLNRLKTETWVGDGNVVTYSYDTESNLLDVADDFSRLSYEYDARYRVTSVDNHGSQAGGTPRAPRVVVDYAYDAASNVLSVIDTINGSAGATTGYDYDALDRLAKLTQTGAGLSDKRVDFGYNDLSQTTSIERYRNLAGTQKVVGTSFVYDTLNRLESISHDNAVGSPVAFYDYVYDDASRITRITDVDGVTNYGYDSRDQLTSANHSAPGQADESYDYDANGNREASHLHGTGYVVGPGNRLLSDGTYNYTYDDEGNTVKRTEIATGNYREFTWDHRNRLTKVVDKLASGTRTQEVEFTYDAFDRRISKSVDTTPLDAVDAAIMSFVYDREDVILDFVDADGAGASPAVLDQRYLHGPAIDQVLAQDDGAGATHWMLMDHLGSVRDLVTQNGTVAEHVTYDSFGNAEGASVSRYQFTGREFDEETELSYYRSRYLDSNTGSFLSQDSLRFGAGDSNLSRYVGNNAPNLTDPSGNNPILVGIGLGLLLDWFSRPNIANAPGPETNTLPGYSDLDYLRQDAFGAMCSLGIGAAAKPLAKGLSSLAGRSNQSSLPNNLFHYTDEATAGLIERSQLGLPGRTTYLTPNGQLSPVQAQIELALPQTNTAGAIFEINTLGLDASKVLLQQRVPGNVFNRGGGGVEILYNGTIPLESVRRVR